MNDVIALFVISIFLISLVLSIKMADSFSKKNPQMKPYTWGYFFGISSIGIYGLAGLYSFHYSFFGAQRFRSDEFALGLFMCALCAIYYFCIKRSRLAWILGTIIHMNPIIWIVNWIYIRNRWEEMSPSNRDGANGLSGGIVSRAIAFIKHYIFRLSRPARMVLAGSLFWAIVVLSFVIMFSPYGRYMNDDDVWQVFKIIVIPPFIAYIGYILYLKLVHEVK